MFRWTLLWSYHWAPLKKTWLWCLYTLPSGIYVHPRSALSSCLNKFQLSQPFLRAEMLRALLVLLWTVSGMSMSLLYWEAQRLHRTLETSPIRLPNRAKWAINPWETTLISHRKLFVNLPFFYLPGTMIHPVAHRLCRTISCESED